MLHFRSLLFAPATRPDRFERALASGADAICLDLEDAVPPQAKEDARRAAEAFLLKPRHGGPVVGVRINALNSAWYAQDLEVAAAADFVMLPKAISADQIVVLGFALPAMALWPLVESAEGMMRAWEIAAAPGVAGVLFGAFDYAGDLGCSMSWEALLFARSRLAVACARAGVALLDSPPPELDDTAGLTEETARAKALGFTGRACIHPTQLARVNHVYTPTPSEIDHARRVIEVFDAADGQAAQLDGRLVELPVAIAARRVLARARS